MGGGEHIGPTVDTVVCVMVMLVVPGLGFSPI